MHRLSLMLAMLIAGASSAQSFSTSAEPLWRRLFLGGSGGASYVFFEHPLLRGRALVPTYTVQAGLALSPIFTVGLEFDGLSRYVERESVSGPFSLFASAADCLNCVAPAKGAIPLSVNASFTTVAGRFDVAPLGTRGPYAAGLVGVALTQGFSFSGASAPTGISGGGRLGYRYRVNHTLELVGEVGFQGQWYDHARLLMPTAQAMARLYL